MGHPRIEGFFNVFFQARADSELVFMCFMCFVHVVFMFFTNFQMPRADSELRLAQQNDLESQSRAKEGKRKLHEIVKLKSQIHIDRQIDR